ncbi:MAG: HD domain-containing protein [Eubacterium sp.]|nr:HD domain-containing protein [Eubacterium sp.]
MRRKAQRNRENDVLIKRYGSDILASEEFKVALAQTHHHRSSVGDHSIHTARAGLSMCNVMRKAGIRIDEKKIVRISLLHDLGILGRDEKYKNNFECGYRHPKDSAEVAKKLWRDIDKKSVRAIRSHMWPLSPTMPTSKEAFILCIADKATALGDRFNRKDRRIVSPIIV